jgi:excisionase family DNA binding protein
MNKQISIPSIRHILTVEEAASYLNCSSDTIYSMTHFPDGSDGVLPHFHMGKAIRFYQALLDLWIINNSQGLAPKDLIDFKKAYLNNVGRKEMELSQSEVSHG